jgi:demethylmenaquinone methyltransferase/2-methoxy-6-polyprenyl-1,4-benzoquinol methylase
MDNLIIKNFFDERACEWDSHERTPMSCIEELLLFAQIKSGERVLDVGCGTGVISGSLMQKSGDVTAVDLSEKMIAEARKKYEGSGIRFVCADLYSFEDGLFDCIVIYNAYPHFTDKAALECKLGALLKTGGRLVIIHSMGREKLNAHHSGHEGVSAPLQSAEREEKNFENLFKADLLIDEADRYVLRFIKK